MNISSLTEAERLTLARAEIEMLPADLFSLRGSWAQLKDAFYELAHAA
ncbi:hypothetical protein CCANI_12530 [Corynebacterium canis]|nr:hypothetical protein [Corynebacterium canis]WJY76312.1 hypothetical protein CCANI_12530 [Corynebacterium canis]